MYEVNKLYFSFINNEYNIEIYCYVEVHDDLDVIFLYYILNRILHIGS